MSILSNLANTTRNLTPQGILSGAAYAASGGRIGSDFTPNYSATNSGRTQLNNGIDAVYSNNQPISKIAQGVTGDDAYGKFQGTGTNGLIDPRQITTGAYTGGAGGGGVDLSSYDQGINQYNDQLGGLSTGLNNGLAQAQSQYQTTLNGLAQNKAQTDQQYTQGKTSNQQDYVTNKNTIKTNTGQTIGSISRLAGARGASGQSAVDYARLLAAGQGTQQLSGAGTAFGKNQQALDSNYGNYIQGYNQNLKSAEDQKISDENSVKASTATSRASILQQLAGLVNQRTSAAGGKGTGASQPYLDQARQAQAEAQQFSAPRPVAAQTPLVYKAPELASYTANPSQIDAGAGAGAPADTVTPLLSALLGNNRDKQLAGV